MGGSGEVKSKQWKWTLTSQGNFLVPLEKAAFISQRTNRRTFGRAWTAGTLRQCSQIDWELECLKVHVSKPRNKLFKWMEKLEFQISVITDDVFWFHRLSEEVTVYTRGCSKIIPHYLVLGYLSICRSSIFVYRWGDISEECFCYILSFVKS